MRMNPRDLEPCQTHLHGFNGSSTVPIGVVKLPVRLGSKEHRRVRTLQFTVLNIVSPYNAFLGRPALTEFRAVIAPWCLTLKFPTINGVGVVQGDQVDLRTVIRRNRVARLRNAEDRLKTFERNEIVIKKEYPALPHMKPTWKGSHEIKQELGDGIYELTTADGLASPKALDGESLRRYCT